MPVRVGISGWTYAPWRGVFYPKGLGAARELGYAASKLSTIEINGTFYALQKPNSYLNWAASTPVDFVFSVKGGRFITHMKKLAGVETALANFFASGVLALGPKLGPCLWQLPPTLGFDAGRLERFFDLLPRTTAEAARMAQGHDEKMTDRAWTVTDADRPLRHALEVRHASFLDPAFVPLLRAHDIAVVTADTAGTWPQLLDRTSDFHYVRLHGDDGRDVFVYFDNDVKVRAPFDAMELARRLTSADRPPTAAPAAVPPRGGAAGPGGAGVRR